MDLKIVHDKERQRFFCVINGKECEMTYKQIDERILNFDHTFVPKELRGQKIAYEIVKTALEYAGNNGYKVIPGCPYVELFFERYEEYKDVKHQQEKSQ